MATLEVMPARALPEIARNIHLGEDGVWLAPSSPLLSFPEEGHAHCLQVEDDSFWFRHRSECLRWALETFPPSGTFFDIGGGNGFVARDLQRAGLDVVMVEPSPEGARNAVARGVRQVVCGDLESIGLVPGSVSAAGLFDVVEHIERDRAFLRALQELQPRGGQLYVTVPAMPSLWSGEDEQGGHFRRYTRASIAKLLEEAGYAIEFVEHIFGFLVLPVFLRRALPYRVGIREAPETTASVRADHLPPAFVEALLQRFSDRELARLRAGKRSHWGTSCLAVARKG